MIDLKLLDESESIELKLDENSKGGTNNYNELDNKPKINGVDLQGDLTLEELGIILNAVKNVLINGASVVDKNGVANIPIATKSSLGIVGVNASMGIDISNVNGTVYVAKATNEQIDARTNEYKPIVPKNLDYAVKQSLCDGKGAEWTPQEKEMARNRLGLDLDPVIIDIETAEDVRVIEIVEHDGKPLREYAFTQMWVYVESASGLTPTSNELQVRINNRNAIDTIPCLCAPTNFLINTTTQYWGGYLDTRNGIALSRTSATTYKHWRSDAQIQANMYELLFQKNINEVYLAGVITNIPKGTKFKIVLR